MTSPVLSVSEKKHTTEYYCLNRAHILYIYFQYQMKTWNYLSAFTGWGGGGHSRPFCDDVRGDGGLESKMILHGDFLNTGGDWSPEIQWNNIQVIPRARNKPALSLSLWKFFLFFFGKSTSNWPLTIFCVLGNKPFSLSIWGINSHIVLIWFDNCPGWRVLDWKYRFASWFYIKDLHRFQ